jgi:nucleoside-diphosphate-sugar epimerase
VIAAGELADEEHHQQEDEADASDGAVDDHFVVTLHPALPIVKQRATVNLRVTRDPDPTILITGAAGNLGSLLARHLLQSGHTLRLMYHRTPIAPDLLASPCVQAVCADLRDPRTLPPAVEGVSIMIHFAGVLFAPRPERFLHETNTVWFSNVLHAALAAGVERVILASFPHVEGPTTVEHPATGRLDRQPISVHARTRLAEEQILFARTGGTATTPVVLRFGLVYGPGILMIEAARWLAARRLLGVWREPTLFHLLSTADYLRATEAAIVKAGVHGIYHVGDEQPVAIQEFLDLLCGHWGYRRPIRVPFWSVYAAATLCEIAAWIARTKSPLTRDFVTLGRVSHWGDTRRARAELIPRLEHPTLREGLTTL